VQRRQPEKARTVISTPHGRRTTDERSKAGIVGSAPRTGDRQKPNSVAREKPSKRHHDAQNAEVQFAAELPSEPSTSLNCSAARLSKALVLGTEGLLHAILTLANAAHVPLKIKKHEKTKYPS
jgi:hypothetical protein